MTTKGPEKGDQVSWNWGGGAPGGTVAETKHEGQIAIESKRGNTIKKNASPDNPAVHIARSGNDVVKRASELTVEAKASAGEKGTDDNSHGGKRKAESPAERGDDGIIDDAAAGDQDGPHAINKQGKEVKKGGKDANKQQKKHQVEDVKGKTEDDVKPLKKTPDGQAQKNSRNVKGTARGKTTASRGAEDVVSARTRSHEKVA